MYKIRKGGVIPYKTGGNNSENKSSNFHNYLSIFKNINIALLDQTSCLFQGLSDR